FCVSLVFFFFFFFFKIDFAQGYFFFFQAEDGIRDTSVTGVQTCALPICPVDERLHILLVSAHDESCPNQAQQGNPEKRPWHDCLSFEADSRWNQAPRFLLEAGFLAPFRSHFTTDNAQVHGPTPVDLGQGCSATQDAGGDAVLSAAWPRDGALGGHTHVLDFL